MGRKSKKKASNRLNRKHWTKAATALWDLVANKRIPDAIIFLFELIGLRVALALLARKAGGDESADAEAVNLIASVLDRTKVKVASGFHAPH